MLGRPIQAAAIVLLYFGWQYALSRRTEDTTASLGFLRDAFGSAVQRAPEADAALKYVRAVFGAPGASYKTRLFYMLACALTYVICAAGTFTLAYLGHQATHQAAWMFVSRLWIIGLALFAWCIGMQISWRRRLGSARQRHEAVIRAIDVRCLNDERTATPEKPTPWWWLYATTMAMIAENLGKFSGRAARLLVGGAALLVSIMLFMGAHGTLSSVVGWFLFLEWTSIGWLLPLDGLVKLASWNGPGNFAVAVLRANQPD